MSIDINQWYAEINGVCPYCQTDFRKCGPEYNLFPHFMGACKQQPPTEWQKENKVNVPTLEPQFTEMASLREIKQRLAAIELLLHVPTYKATAQNPAAVPIPLGEALSAIEQGQGILCERLDGLAKVVTVHDEWAKAYNVTVEQRNARVSEQAEEWESMIEQLITKLDAIQAAMLHQDFKQNRGKHGKNKRKHR